MATRVWRADDGKICDTKAEAEAHEAEGEHSEMINEYMKSVSTDGMTDLAAKKFLNRERNTAARVLKWKYADSADRDAE